MSKKDELDIVMFPEMAFSGYCFEDLKQIRPCLELAGKGKNFEFMSVLAKKLGAYVVGGYPEVRKTAKGKEEYYNSMYVIDRKGELLLNYSKHFLFETDKVWAKPGKGFQTVQMTNRAGVEFKAGLAICMDINPEEFRDCSEYELANHMKEE